jgi:ABC-type multidrug transport system permease subunit
MNNFNKYFKLMALLFGGFIGFIGLITGIFYLLKLFSVTLFYIPGFDHFFSFIMIIIPYVIFFCGYYYLHKKIPLSKSKTAAVAARVVMILGSLLCAVTMVLSTLKLFGVHKTFLLTFDEKSQYGWMIQIVILFFTALIVASGDAKEKDWMHKKVISDEL